MVQIKEENPELFNDIKVKRVSFTSKHEELSQDFKRTLILCVMHSLGHRRLIGVYMTQISGTYGFHIDVGPIY